MLAAGSKVVGYSRVSTEDQAEKGSSMRSQPEVIRAHCAYLGLDLVLVEEDGGESSKTMDRPGLQRVLGMLDRGEVAGVVVAYIDRLTRSIRDAADLVDRYFTTPGGCELISTAQEVDTRSARGRFFFFLDVLLSQFQRESGVERTVKEMTSKRGRSELLGRDRFGFKADPGDHRRTRKGNPSLLVPDEADAAVVAEIHRHWRFGSSLRLTALALDVQGFKPKRGAKWSASTVAKIRKMYPLTPES